MENINLEKQQKSQTLKASHGFSHNDIETQMYYFREEDFREMEM